MSTPLFAYPTLTSISTSLLTLSRPVHPLLPTIPLLLPLHAIRVAIAWEQIRSSKRPRDGSKEGGLKNLVGYLVMAFGGSTLTSLLLRTPPSWLLSFLLLPLYSLVYLLLPTRLLLSLVPSLPLNFILALLDATNRLLSITTLLHHPALPKTNTLLASFFLSGLGTVGGGVLASMFGLWEEEWTVQTPSLVKTLSFGEGVDGFIWGGMDFWSAGVMALLLPTVLPSTTANNVDASGLGSTFTTLAQYLAPLLGIQEKDVHALTHTVAGWIQKGGAEGKAWTSLEARTICTVILGGLLGSRVVVLYSRAWWKQVVKVTTIKEAEVDGKNVAVGREKKPEKVGELVEATTSSVDVDVARVDSPRKSPKARQRVKKRS